MAYYTSPLFKNQGGYIKTFPKIEYFFVGMGSCVTICLIAGVFRLQKDTIGYNFDNIIFHQC